MILEVLDMIGCPPNVKVQLPKKLEIVNAEKIAITQVFINLIGNAIKHHGKGQILINIYFEKTYDYYHFFVEDNGVGIPENQLENIFKLFITGKNCQENHGIGLNSVKSIIEEAGGMIRVTSQENVGTKFEFTLPVPQ